MSAAQPASETVVLLHDVLPVDARPDEQDALVQAEAVCAALGELGLTGVRRTFRPDRAVLAAELAELDARWAFNLVESVEGKGRLCYLAPALLEVLRIPCTGASSEALFLTSSKTLTKRLLAAAGIDTPPWFAPAGPPAALPPLPGRYIIKSVDEEASLGIGDDSIVAVGTEADLRAEVEQRTAAVGGRAFAEHYIEGREFNLSLLCDGEGVEVLPPAEIDFRDYPRDKPRVVGYRAKWAPESFEYHNTPRRLEAAEADAGLLEKLRGIARRSWEVFDLSGYARVDFRVDEAGRPWVLEINANPCLSPDAGFMAAAAAAGLSYAEVVRRLLADADRRAVRI